MNEAERDTLRDLRFRIRKRNSLSKDGSEERTLTMNQLDALDFALDRIDKLDRLEKWLINQEEQVNDKQIEIFRIQFGDLGQKVLLSRKETLKDVRLVLEEKKVELI